MKQIRNERLSEAIYLSMSAWYESTPYKGLAAKHRAAALEEHGHAMKFYDYLTDRDGGIRILPVEAPPHDYESVISAAKAALSQEQKVSAQIRNIYAVAQSEGDYETLSFLKWFLDEHLAPLPQAGLNAARDLGRVW
jgi:ferritin